MLGDLNDFITPAQACVNPLFTSSTGEKDLGVAKISLDSGVFSGLEYVNLAAAAVSRLAR